MCVLVCGVCRCPSGYKVQRLDAMAITTMLKECPYSAAYTAPIFKKLEMPKIGLYLSRKQNEDYLVDACSLCQADPMDMPVSYASWCYFGDMGMLRCVEEHWTDSKMALLVQVLARLMKAMGIITILHVEDTNINTNRLMEGLPGWDKEPHFTWTWSCNGSACP